MKRHMIKKLSVLLMAVMLVLPMLGGLEVYAAAKPSLDKTKLTIGVGTHGFAGETTRAFCERLGKYCVNVVNSKKGASYIFTSSNKKVATVKTVKGEKTTGYITGVKPGTATITVQQKLKGKLTKVGSCKVTVKEATVKASVVAKKMLSVGIGTWSYAEADEAIPICEIDYINPKATYTFECKDKNFSMKQKMQVYPLWGDDFKVYAQTYTAKKAGTYTVTVKETYKKKTKTLGKIKVKVFDNSLLKNEVTLAVGQELGLQGLLKYSNGGWMVDCDEEDILEPGKDEWYGMPIVRGIKPGTAKLKYRYDFGDGKSGDKIGVCTVTVKEVKVTDIELKNEIINVSEDDILDYGYDPLQYEYTIITDSEDLPYMGGVTFTSSDEKVVSINSDGRCVVEGVGSATVTITAGDVSKTVTVNILADDEYDEYDEYDDYDEYDEY